eukprot:4653467-Amphidinium_carterae.1
MQWGHGMWRELLIFGMIRLLTICHGDAFFHVRMAQVVREIMARRLLQLYSHAKKNGEYPSSG